MGRRWDKVGILAGGGKLPVALAEACVASGAPYHVIRLAGYAEEELELHPGDTCGLAEVGKIIRCLKAAECDAVVFVGLVSRPNFAALRPDWRGAALLPKVVKAARRGDGALLDALVSTFDAEGFLVLGAEEVAAPLRAGAGALGAHGPGPRDFADIRKAAAVVAALGPFDVGQGAVVRNGYVLAVEAAEGTDAMLERCAALPEGQRGFEPGERPGRCGVLLKQPKPGQELRVDLPTIGVRTVELAAEAGLAGLAVAADAALILEREAMVAAADDAGLFVYGYRREELRAPRD